MILVPGAHMIWQFQEFGYDEGIDTWGGRTDPKPVKWAMLQDPDNKGLFDNYRELIKIRLENTDLFPISGNFANNCSGWANGRTIIAKAAGKELYCAINPNVTGEVTVNVDFASSDNSTYWIASKSYGSDPKFDAVAKTITVPAGCYAIVSTRNISGIDDVTTDTMTGQPIAIGGRGCITLTSDLPASIYNMEGMEIATIRGENHIALPAGVYIVRSGNVISKVMVR